jgi:ABC-type Mn2+/Zn2+ transport system ATPase subunit
VQHKPDAEPLISFKDVCVGYGGKSVASGIDFEVLPGSFWGILGHNGSGKTTLLRTVLKLIPPMSGRVHFHGAKTHALRYGYVPQKERLDPIYPLRVRDVVGLGTCRRFRLDFWNRAAAEENQSIVLRAMMDCGVNYLADRRFSELSGGQKQRVLIARALASLPSLLVLDEPLAGIDITTQTALLDFLRQLRQRRDLTVLMVSHRISAEKDLFTHIAWVDEGKVETGPVEAMLSHGKLSRIFKAEL